MANLKEVRDRISSVRNTQQITKAMKMVAAAKLRRAQQAIQQMRPYADKLDAMLKNILSNLEGDVQSGFGQEREVKKACIVVVTSNRGLAGAFNTNIIKKALAMVEGKYAHLRENGNLSMHFVGKKGYDYFRKRYKDINLIHKDVMLSEDLGFENVARVSQGIMDAFENGEYDEVQVVYAHFKNAAVQYAEVAQFLPVAKMEGTAEEGAGKQHRADYIFEPDKEGLLEYLIPSILQTTFQKYLLDTHASEHGARMTAMDSATENAQELLNDLKLSYNKARQEAITKELSEIVGGAAALESA
jgi:F-type H+-transporting ATPase subunit gamma